MPISCQHSVDVAQPPERVFAILDDPTRTPEWLDRCTGIEVLTPGEHAVGTKLRYSYRDGGRSGRMDGEVTARVPNERLTMRYGDKMMDVTVDFRVAGQGGGSRLTHQIDISPRTVMAKLFAPMIRKQLPKQTIAAMEKLKALAERSA